MSDHDGQTFVAAVILIVLAVALLVLLALMVTS